MNKIILLVLLGMASNLFAQNNGKSQKKQERAEREAKIEEARIAFITKELNLTSEKSEKFWPVYNAYSSQRKAIMKDMRKMKKSINKEGEITNEQALQIIDKKLITEEKMLNLNKSYKNKFLAVLTPKEYLKLHKVEREFLHWLREKSDLKRKGNHNGEGAGPPQGVNH